MITHYVRTLELRHQASLKSVRHDYATQFGMAALHSITIRLEQGLPVVAPVWRKGV